MAVKASKRLLTAVLACVVSLVLCLGVCVAWFTSNNQTDVNNVNSDLRGGDIVSFDITAYYLDADGAAYKLADDGNVTVNQIDYDVDQIPKGTLESGDDMRPFGGFGSSGVTAVLIKFNYELLPSESAVYKIFSACSAGITVQKTAGEDKFTSSLSNVVGFYDVTKTDAGYAFDKNLLTGSFVDGNSKLAQVTLEGGIAPKADGGLTLNAKGNYEGELYVVMDYVSNQFTYISSKVIEEGGTLLSRLEFLGDVEFGISVYDASATVIPTSISLASGATEFKEGVTAANIRSGWQFAVRYSDGTVGTVSASSTNIMIGEMDLTLGKHTVSVQYKHQSGEIVACSVEYVINERAAESVPVTSVSLDKSTMSLKVGESSALTATVLPENATDKKVSWSSSNSAVASVSGGTVTAVSPGTAMITVTTSDGKMTANCDVTVTKVAVSKIELSKTAITLNEGTTATVTATVSPADATYKTVTWTTDNAAVAMVSDGVITAVGAGTATITATADGKSAGCTVTVEQAAGSVTTTLNSADFATMYGDSAATTASGSSRVVNDGYTYNNKFTFNGTTHRIDKSGSTYSYNNQANGTITVTLSGKTNSFAVTGGNASSGSASSIYIKEKNAADGTKIGEVAVGASFGTITVPNLGAGEYTLYATGGSLKISEIKLIENYDQTVTQPTVSGVTVSGAPAGNTMKVNDTANLTATVTMSDNSTNSAVTWSSSNNDIATVSNGTVTAKAEGSVTITATSTQDNTKSASCTITVTAAVKEVTGFTLSASAKTVKVGESFTLTVSNITPADATDKSVTWTTDNAAVATVSDGAVTAKAEGTATITAKIGNIENTCTVTVEAAGTPTPSSITVTEDFSGAKNKNSYEVTLSDSAKTYLTSIVVTRTSSTIGLSSSKYLKLQSTTLMTFVAAKDCTVRIYMTGATSIKIDGEEIKLNGATYYDLAVKSGATYKVEKGSGEAIISKIEIIP